MVIGYIKIYTIFINFNMELTELRRLACHSAISACS